MLLSLLSSGAVPPIPKYASSAVHRHAKSAAASYGELEKAFLSSSAADLDAALSSHADLHKSDGNFGLASLLPAAQPRRAAQRLTGTHVSLPLPDLGRMAGLGGGAAAAADLLRHMVARGEIFATVDSRAQLACFSDQAEAYSTPAVARRIRMQLSNIEQLNERVRAKDEALARHPAWLAKTGLGERAGAGAVGGLAAAVEAAMEEAE